FGETGATVFPQRGTFVSIPPLTPPTHFRDRLLEPRTLSMKTSLPRAPRASGEAASVETDSRFPRRPTDQSESPPAMLPRSRRRSLRKNLRNSMSDGAAFSVMVGTGETYFPAFVLAMGMGEIAAGLVASIPILVGAILQMVSPAAVVKLGSNRRWV